MSIFEISKIRILINSLLKRKNRGKIYLVNQPVCITHFIYRYTFYAHYI